MDIPTLDGIRAEEVTTARLTTRVLFSGSESGIPVVFVHGNVSSATFWEETMLALPQGFRGIAADNRGYGGADPNATINAKRGMGDLADDFAELLGCFKALLSRSSFFERKDAVDDRLDFFD